MSVTYFDVSGGRDDPAIDANFRGVNWIDGGNLASASTVANTAIANFYHITGTTTITKFSDITDDDGNYGRVIRVVFDGALQLTHSANLFLCNAGGNITTAANDVATFVNDGANVYRCTSYTRADGSALSASAASMTLTGNLEVGGNAHFGTKTTAAIAGGVATVDWSLGNKAYLNLSENLNDALDVLFTPPGGAANLTLHINQVGAFTISAAAWPATVLWPGGVAPTITVGAGADDLLTFYWDGTNYFGSYLQAYA
jgi:hypothetical protein